MNNEQQTWILKPDVKINDYKVMGSEFLLTESFKLELDGEMGFAPKYLFQPLDISGLTRQVEESLTFLCQYAYDAGYTIGNDRTVTGKDVDLSVKATALEIVGLLLNQEGETK